MIEETPVEQHEEQPQASVPEPERNYVLVFCSPSESPRTLTVVGTQAMLEKLREEYQRNAEPYAFVVEGQLGQLAKAGNKLIVSFPEYKVHTGIEKRVKKLTDGWLGD